MQNSRANEIKVGIVTIAALAIAVFGIGYVKNAGLASQGNEIHFLFDRTAGINNSAPIFVNGVERGKVSEVDNYEGKVKVSGYIDNKEDLKQDASASIMILEITGGKKIEINPGKSEEKFSGEYIPGVSVSDLSELVSVVNDVSGDAITLIRRLDTITASVNNIMKDTMFIYDVKNTASNVSEFSENANNFLKNNSGKLNKIIDDLADISERLDETLEKNEPKISAIIDDIDRTISNANELISSANTSAEKINDLVSDINGLIDDIKTEKSIINKILYDKEFAAKLDSAFTDLGSFVKLIEKHGVNVNLRIGTRP
jgi:phospholipid/cholesterol/gamma-HCH transport system substrate-binding protein